MMRPIYLDYNATTPVAPEVASAIRPWLEQEFGNPSSTHAYGERAREALSLARARVAALLGAGPEEILFSGSATEANNLAVIGAVRALPQKRHLVISAVEHPAVMQPALHLRELGFEVTVLPVDSTGRVSIESVVRALRPDTALISVMHANNEVGTLQPVAEIARIAHQQGILVHTDAAQSIGKIPVDVNDLGVDLLTVAGHKVYAPKGIGALYIRTGTPLAPVLFGGNQERSLRPGTENVAFAAGLGAACELARGRLPGVVHELSKRADQLYRALSESVPALQLNGHPSLRLPNTLHVSFPNIGGRDLLAEVAEEVCASVGSACHAATDRVSGVLAAMGMDAPRARGAVRLSVGWPTSEQDVDEAARALGRAWERLAAAK
jgi:cysteine desulfurase